MASLRFRSGDTGMSNDKKGGGEKPTQGPREQQRKSDDGPRNGRIIEEANRTTDWVKPERPKK